MKRCIIYANSWDGVNYQNLLKEFKYKFCDADCDDYSDDAYEVLLQYYTEQGYPVSDFDLEDIEDIHDEWTEYGPKVDEDYLDFVEEYGNVYKFIDWADYNHIDYNDFNDADKTTQYEYLQELAKAIQEDTSTGLYLKYVPNGDYLISRYTFLRSPASFKNISELIEEFKHKFYNANCDYYSEDGYKALLEYYKNNRYPVSDFDLQDIQDISDEWTEYGPCVDGDYSKFIRKFKRHYPFKEWVKDNNINCTNLEEADEDTQSKYIKDLADTCRFLGNMLEVPNGDYLISSGVSYLRE